MFIELADYYLKMNDSLYQINCEGPLFQFPQILLRDTVIME